MGDGKAASGKRAIGIRDRIISYLTMTGDIADATGMASAMLAQAVGYPGSSAAFAQLLSGMERAGLIRRQIRGKRTYRISLGGAAWTAQTTRAHEPDSRPRPAPQVPAAPVPVRAELVAGVGADTGFDYDELARRLLVQVVRRLAAGVTPPVAAFPGQAEHPVPVLESDDLAAAVASLEQRLTSVQSRQRRLTAENAELREQLRAAQRSLMAVQERAERPAGQLDTAEMRLLDRLLFPLREQPGQRGEAGAS